MERDCVQATMLRKPTWKRWRRMEREARERCKAPLAVDDDYTGTGDVERFNIKKKVMKSRFGKSLSRFQIFHFSLLCTLGDSLQQTKFI